MHDHGIIHRYIKPQNIKVDNNGKVWVAITNFKYARRMNDR